MVCPTLLYNVVYATWVVGGVDESVFAVRTDGDPFVADIEIKIGDVFKF